MVFSSLQFIFLFLPIVILIYYLIGLRYRNVFLLLASFVFYAYGEPRFAIVMFSLCFVNWALGYLIYIARRKKNIKKVLLVIGIITDVGVLFVYKYLNFITANINRFFNISVTKIALPIGISFFTFQMLSYIIDVYRDPERQICKNPINVGLYISFFSQLIAGPIVRYNTIINQIKNRDENVVLFGRGVERFIIGLSKKVLLANNMAVVADKAFGCSGSGLSMGFAWLGALAYTFQIYFDFSGYSDMAIGLGKMFGFTFNENFNYPYIAKSVTDFWRRWHISLSTWFRDYVYIPLGGDGRNNKQQDLVGVRNLLVVWLLTGIWHGAYWTFIIWGLCYFVLLFFEKKLLQPESRSNVFKCFYRLFTGLAVMLLWVVFRAESISSLCCYVKALLCYKTSVVDNNFIFYLREYFAFFIVSTIAATPIAKYTKSKVTNVKSKIIITAIFLLRVLLIVALLVSSISYIVMGYYNPFIYFNF